MEELPALARRLGYPGAEKLHLAARRQGLGLSRAEVSEFVRRQGARQLFERVRPSAGRSAAEGPDARYQADLIDLSAEAREEGGHRYILCLVNVFTRELFCRALKSKTPAEVEPVLEAMLRARPALPQFLLTDQGAEFRGPVDAMLKRLGVVHHEKSTLDLNSLAVLDRAIQNLKGRVARLLAAGHHTSWAAALREAVAGYNHTYHSTVHGSPDEAHIPTLRFMAYEDNAAKLEHNERLARRRVASLGETFRRPLGPPTRYARGFHAKYGPLERVREVKGTQVHSSTGPPIDVKHVLPVHPETTEARAVLARGSGAVERKREQLEGLAQALRRFVSRKPKTMAAAAAHLREAVPEYDELLRTTHLTLAGLVRLFPETLAVELGPGEATIRRA